MYFYKINNNVYYFIFSNKIIKKDHQQFSKDLIKSLESCNNKLKLVFDFINVSEIDYSLIQIQANFMNQYKEQVKTKVDKSSIIIPNYWCRLLLNSLFYLCPPVTPYMICQNYEESDQWFNS